MKSPSAAAPPRPLRADAARNRQALIDAAQRLFATKGLGVTLDDIAAEAGVNVATAYRHFANKGELAEAFLHKVLDEAVRILDEAAAQDDPWDGVVAFFTETLAFMSANQGLHDVFTPGRAEQSLQQLDERAAPVLAGLLTRAQKAGAVRADFEPGDVGVVFQMLATLRDIPSSDPELVGRRYLAFVLSALRPSDVPLPGAPPTAVEVRAAHLSGRRTSRR